ncbi:MAG: T9SS type A sorting domain-containing protein [Candidatus Aegiribacteria sp.]|nr:T9SS type A sorting domain-containing protein [Candidatus Aegiribacteria sp.]
MKRIAQIIILIVLSSVVFGADRVVLLEDFTNCGCGPCWSFEPTLNAFISSHPNDLAVVRPHVSWPSGSDPIYLANPAEQNFRKSIYGVNSVPWIQFGGTIKASNSSGGLISAFNSRMAVPCHLEIQVENYVIYGSGTIQITLIAEEDLGDTDLKVHAIIVESGIPGVGYFASSTFEQAFREELFGATGQDVSFGPSYPDTVVVNVDYDTGGWVFENLQLAVFVQNHASSGTEVHNAFFEYLGAVTGLEGDDPEELNTVELIVQISPNPSSGSISLSAGDLYEGTGVLAIYDTSGRCIANGTVNEDAVSHFEIDETGVYFARVTSGGKTATSRIVVVR